MCGIAGELRPYPEPSEHASRQLECLRHRGPDAEGVFEQTRAWIGQTRLSVIDLQTGDPPIANEDGTVGVALNGEIYNYRQLRRTLREQGRHVFASEGDTEVIAHLAEDVEPAELARRLDGMFALAVWDEKRERLLLARDRFGKKPLYYWSGSGRLVFASEIKSVLANPHVPRRLRSEALAPYLTFGYVPTPDTFFEGVRSVPPGHVLIAEPRREPRIERYWSPPLAGLDGVSHLDLSMREAARDVRETLETAVRRRLLSDVPLGAFLSGGIDSSAIVGIMARALDRPVQTFTIGFEDSDGFDERPYARLVAERHGTDHHEFVVRANAVELVERLVWHHDQPFGDSSAIPTFLLSEVTRGHVTVALSGEGGDELFAGYERFAAGLAARRYAALPGVLQRALRAGLELAPTGGPRRRIAGVRRFARAAERGLPDAYGSWISCVGEQERHTLLNGRHDDGVAAYRRIWASSEGAHPLDRLLDLNLRTYLLDDLLVKVDRMSMAHGLEVRCPFLDPQLLALASRLRPSLKARGLSLKRVLRAAVEDLLPAEIKRRSKRGFGVPLDRWFREDLRAYLDATLGAPDARVRRHLAPAALDRLLAEHDSGASGRGRELWTLLTLEVFLRREGW